MIRISSIAARLTMLLCMGLLVLPPALTPAHAQRKGSVELPPAPPPPMAKTVTLKPGETATVELGIHGSRAQQLEFVVRTQPKKGKLSAVQITGVNTGVIKYTAGKEPGEDRFTFAVRNNDGMSAPAAVTITIVPAPELPARLFAQDVLEFPELIVGRENTATLELANQGGAMAEGELTVPEGWSVEGTTAYQLAGGKRAVFKLVFAPKKAGEFSGNAVFGPKPQRAVLLRGMAKAPLEFSPATLELSAAPTSQTREGVLHIENRTEEPRKLGIIAGPRVMVERTATVPAGGSVDLRVYAAADDAGALDEKLKIESAAWSAEVPVRARPIAAMIRFAGKALDFGKVVAGVPAEAEAVIENSGGLPAVVAVRVDAPFEVAAAGLEVPARGSTKVPVRLVAKDAGKVSAVLVADTGTGTERISITVDVEPKPDATPPPPPRPVLPGGPGNAPRPTASSPTAKPGAGLPPVPELADVPGKMGKYMTAITSSSAVVEWPSTLGAGDGLSVDERLVTKGPDGMPVISWRVLRSAKVSEAGGKRRAELQDLDPARLYVVRVTSKGEPVFVTKFVTLRAKPWIDVSFRGVIIVLLLGGLGFVGWRKWKGRVKGGW